MARKQQKRRAQQRSVAPRPASPTTVPQPRSVPAGQRVGGEQATIRSVEMSLGGQAVMRGKGRGRYVLESGDAGIPLDRVPYFMADLRQVLFVGLAMIVILVAAAFLVVPQFLK